VHPALAAAAALAALGLVGLAYLPAFRVPLLMDDQVALLDNPTIRGGPFHLEAWRPPGDGNTVQGRPVLNASFALGYVVGGVDPAVHRAFNLALHLANALLLAVVLRLAFRSPRWAPAVGPRAAVLAAAAAWLWALHPLQTLSVTYVAQRAESLVSFFYLATLAAWLGARAAPRWRGPLLALGVASCALGMLSKEVMVTAPLAALLLDRVLWPRGDATGPGERAFRLGAAGLAATWALLLWQLAANDFARGDSTGAIGFTRVDYLQTQLWAVAVYAAKIAGLGRVQFDHGPRIVDDAASLALAAPFWIAALALGAALARRGRWDVIAALGLFFLLLAPTSSFVPVATQTVAEHRVYLASAVVIAGAVAALDRVARSPGRRAAAAALVLAAGALLAVSTWRQNRFLQDPVRLWQDVAARSPGNGRAFGNLAGALLERGDDDAALAALDRSLALEPANVRSWYNRGNALRRRGDLAGAERDYRRAIELDPRHVQARNNLALLRKQLGDRAEARAQLERVVEIDPGHAPAWLNLATLRLEQGELAAGRDAIERHLALRDDSAKGWAVAAEVRAALGDADGAREARARAQGLAAGRSGAAAPSQRDAATPARSATTE